MYDLEHTSCIYLHHRFISNIFHVYLYLNIKYVLGVCWIFRCLKLLLLRKLRFRQQSLTLRWRPTCTYLRILDRRLHCKSVALEIRRPRRGTRGGTGVKALCHFLSQRFSKFLQMRRSWCIPLRTLLRQLLVWQFLTTCLKVLVDKHFPKLCDLVLLMFLKQSGPREPALLHYLNVVRNVDGWNLRLSPGRRPAGILVLPAGMSRMQLLLAVRRTPIVRSPVDPISG